MQWLYNLNASQYDQLLTILFTHCDSLIFIGTEEKCDPLHLIAYDCIGKRLVKQHASVDCDDSTPVFQYTFICNERTRQYVKEHSFYRLQWQLFAFESLTFWKEEHLVFRVSSKHNVELELDKALEKRIVHLFETVMKDEETIVHV